MSKLKSFITILPVVLAIQINLRAQLANSLDSKVSEALELRYTNYQKSLELLNTYFNECLADKDTLKAINLLREIATINGHHAKYKEAYDCTWKALRLSIQSKNKVAESDNYVFLGRYYGFYKRDVEAFDYFSKSLKIKKDLLQESRIDKNSLVNSYYAFLTTNRELERFSEAKKYLDSCYLFSDAPAGSLQWANLKCEEAILLSKSGRHNNAISLFEEVKKIFNDQLPSYNVLTETFQGQAYRENGQFDKAIESFTTALEISDKYDSHRDFAILIHEYLSEVYFQQGKMNLAYARLKKVKQLDKEYFDSRSINNRSLLEIQDQLRIEQEKAEIIEQNQKVKELEDAEEILFLQRTILIIAIISLALFAYLYVKYLRNIFKSKQKKAEEKRQLELERVNELIETKNKEMAVSSLKLIEKEEIIEDFKKTIEKSNWELEPSKLKRAVKSLEVNHNQTWDEFETRFTAINQNFYKNLHAEFPNLTSSDDKLCALVKLNFNSKDMAKLLGISIESVHTSRYRLRKKLGLDREDNLTDFISKY